MLLAVCVSCGVFCGVWFVVYVFFCGCALFVLSVLCCYVVVGVCHNDRRVAQISVVDAWCRVVLNVYVVPSSSSRIVSYLPALTGLSSDILDTHGIPLEQALEKVKQAIPTNSKLVGQNILKVNKP